MNLLWEEAPRTITQIVSASKEDMAWSKHTVIKMLSRMETKGVVYFTEGEKAKQFYPKVDKNSITIKETEKFLNKVYEGRLGLLVNFMVKEKGISKAELEELNEILRQAAEEEKEKYD
jgi:Predicted transcriptional regulator